MRWTRAFGGEVWRVKGPGGWHFVTIPVESAREIRQLFGGGAWGSVRVEARIGKTAWETSVFPDKPSGSYVLPVKADVRRAESVEAGDVVEVRLTIAR